MKLELVVSSWLQEAPIAVENLEALHGMLKANEACPANLFLEFPGNPGFDAKMRAIVGTALAVATDSYISGIVRDLRVAGCHANPDDFRAARFLWNCMANPVGMPLETWDREWAHWSQRQTRPGLANQTLLLMEGAGWAPTGAPHPESLLLQANPTDVVVCHADTHRFLSGRLISAPRAKLVFPATVCTPYQAGDGRPAMSVIDRLAGM